MSVVLPARTQARSLRVLAVIELGGNWGHLLRLRPVLSALRERGHVTLLATADVEAARRLFADEAVEIIACPSSRSGSRLRRGLRFRHYAEMLAHCAFASDAALGVGMRAWTALLARLRPDVLLTDFAPAALLAAHLHRRRIVQVAMGWEAPRAGEPLPVIRPWEPVDTARFEALEATLLLRLNRCCRAFGVRPLRRVADLYGTGCQLLATWPETDHFGPRDGARYIGPIYSSDYGAPAAWGATNDPKTGAPRTRVLVYLAHDPRNAAIVAAVARTGSEVIAVLPGMASADADRLRQPQVQVFHEAIQLKDLVPRARLVVTNGGHGLLGASLHAGVPTMLLPRTAEQAVLTERVVSSGLARSLLRHERSGVDHAAIQIALADAQSLEAASRVAQRYAGSSQRATIQTVVEALERFCGVAVPQI